VVTLTLKEYLACTKWRRFTYRLYRHPFVTFGLGPHYIFLLNLRLAGKHSGQRERRGVYLTNAALFTLWALSIWSLGLSTVLLIWIPVQIVAGACGVWLFYVQHQYEDAARGA
jgi:omega-6 fatty acid desaturase (delta-12 desaturase)